MYKITKYGASWCSKCRVQDMEFIKNPINYPVETLDVDKLEDTVIEELNIKNLPVVILYKWNDGSWELIKRWNSFVKTSEINEFINE